MASFVKKSDDTSQFTNKEQQVNPEVKINLKRKLPLSIPVENSSESFEKDTLYTYKKIKYQCEIF